MSSPQAIGESCPSSRPSLPSSCSTSRCSGDTTAQGHLLDLTSYQAMQQTHIILCWQEFNGYRVFLQIWSHFWQISNQFILGSKWMIVANLPLNDDSITGNCCQWPRGLNAPIILPLKWNPVGKQKNDYKKLLYTFLRELIWQSVNQLYTHNNCYILKILFNWNLFAEI